ncbi:MAG: hypothetical protein ABI837_16255 [Acidobacteriota bacterium]
MPRLLVVALLLLSSDQVAAQSNEPFRFDPQRDAPAGGRSIEFTTTAIDLRCCGMPQVLFGGVQSPSVTVRSSTALTATTPPHAEGVVDVELRMGGQTFGSFFKFGYERPREQILIPVAIEIAGAYGSRWTTDIWVYNDSDLSVNLEPEVCSFIGLIYPCGGSLVVAARGSLHIPARRQQSGEFPEAYLIPPIDAIPKLHFQVRVRDASGTDVVGSQVPVVRRSDLRPGHLILPNVPISERHRDVLRIFDQSSYLHASITIRAYDISTGVLLGQRYLERFLPTDSSIRTSFVVYDFLSTLRGHDEVRLEIDEADPSAPLWAMLTLTDNATQHVSILTPQ